MILYYTEVPPVKWREPGVTAVDKTVNNDKKKKRKKEIISSSGIIICLLL